MIYLNWNKIIINILPCFEKLPFSSETVEELGMNGDGCVRPNISFWALCFFSCSLLFLGKCGAQVGGIVGYLFFWWVWAALMWIGCKRGPSQCTLEPTPTPTQNYFVLASVRRKNLRSHSFSLPPTPHPSPSPFHFLFWFFSPCRHLLCHRLHPPPCQLHVSAWFTSSLSSSSSPLDIHFHSSTPWPNSWGGLRCLVFAGSSIRGLGKDPYWLSLKALAELPSGYH